MIKAALVVFPGSNRDRDMGLALVRAVGREPLIVWHQESEIPRVDLIVLRGASPTATICARAPWRRARR